MSLLIILSDGIDDEIGEAAPVQDIPADAEPEPEQLSYSPPAELTAEQDALNRRLRLASRKAHDKLHIKYMAQFVPADAMQLYFKLHKGRLQKLYRPIPYGSGRGLYKTVQAL
jgi:hypothetical protein